MSSSKPFDDLDFDEDAIEPLPHQPTSQSPSDRTLATPPANVVPLSRPQAAQDIDWQATLDRAMAIPPGMHPDTVLAQQQQAQTRQRRRHILDDSLLSLALEDQDPEFKNKVFEIVIQAGIDENDAALLVLVATGRLEVLLEERPKEISAMFDQWTDLIHTRLDNYREGLEHYERAAVKAQQKAIAQAASHLVQRVAVEQFLKSIHLTSIGISAFALLAVMGFGTWIGHIIAQAQQAQVRYAPGQAYQLTLEEANALQWAMSSQGKFAKNLVDWNAHLLAEADGNRQCENDVKSLGVTLEIAGHKANSGFCTLWVKPPEQRQFQNKAQP